LNAFGGFSLKEKGKKKGRPAETILNGEQPTDSTPAKPLTNFKITSRSDREKRVRIDSAWSRSNSLCERWFESSDALLARPLRWILWGIFYLFPNQSDSVRSESSYWVYREKMLRKSLHGLAETLPQLVYDRITLLLALLAFCAAVTSLVATGNLLWFLCIGLGMFCLIVSTLSLKYGMKGWILAMILFTAMLGFFLEPKIVQTGLPGLYNLFQLW